MEGIRFMRRMTGKTKEERALGMGEGADYKPYITGTEFSSLGTCACIVDWKHGRGVECLSQAEERWYYVLRWDDDNVDIREQYPLDRERTEKICEKYEINHPFAYDDVKCMTTDFLVTKVDGTYHAFSVKASEHISQQEKVTMFIEKTYWNLQGVPFDILLGNKVDRVLVRNIKLVTEYYDIKRVYDDISMLKYKMAHKIIDFDMSARLITNDVLRRHINEQVFNR